MNTNFVHQFLFDNYNSIYDYRYRKEVALGGRLVFFCRLASQYADELRFMDSYEISGEDKYL